MITTFETLERLPMGMRVMGDERKDVKMTLIVSHSPEGLERFDAEIGLRRF